MEKADNCGDSRTLTPRQEVALEKLLATGDPGVAAKEAGVTARTLRRWLSEPRFSEAYRDARREAVRAAVGALMTAATEAVAALRAIMTNTSAPASAKVSAARAVLDAAMKADELDGLEERISALEAARQGGRR